MFHNHFLLKIVRLLLVVIIVFFVSNFFLPNDLQAACTTDYSGIDGNLIPNPYFECDDNADTIPDGWKKYAPDANHVLSWVDDPLGGGHGKVLKTEYIDNGNPRSSSWQTIDNIDLDANTWYEIDFTYATENVGLNLNGDSTIATSSEWIGIGVNCYTAANELIAYPASNIWPSSAHFTSWDGTDQVFRTYTTTNSSGWNTKTIYFQTYQNTSYATISTYNYPPGTLYVAEIKLKKVDGNINPENVNLSKTGSLDFIQYQNQNFFPIILNDFPTSGGQDISLDEVADAGFNTVQENYRSYSTSDYQDLLLEKNLAVEVILPSLTYAVGYGLKWINDPLSAIDYSGYDTAISYVDEWKDFGNTVLFNALKDESNCNPHSGGTYIGYLDPYENLRSYIDSNSTIPTYGNFCDNYGSSNDVDDLVDYYAILTDVFSFTTNTPNAYDITGPSFVGSAKLPANGYRIREVLSRLKNNGYQSKALAMGLGVYWWSSWDGNSSSLNEYVPFNLQRFQIFDQIINGATGVLFYISGVNLDNAYYNYSFNQMKAITTELSSIYNVLIEPTYYNEWDVDDSRVEIMMKKYNGKIYLFAASTAQVDLENVTITLSSQYDIQSVTAINDINNGDFNNPVNRSITTIDKNSFTDNFIGENSNSPQGYDAPGYDVNIYEITYQIQNTTSESSQSVSVCDKIPPGAKNPQIYDALWISENTARIFFTPPAPPFDHYFIRYKLKDSQDFTYATKKIADVENNLRVVDINDLNPNQEYYFQIRAGNDCQPGDWSNQFLLEKYNLKNFSSDSSEAESQTQSKKEAQTAISDLHNQNKPMSNEPKLSFSKRLSSYFQNLWERMKKLFVSFAPKFIH